MTFPTTRRITDFRVEPNGGPPPTSDYENTSIFEGIVDIGNIIVLDCVAKPDTEFNFCITRYKQPVNLPYEAWIVLDVVTDADVMAVLVASLDETDVVMLYWISNGVSEESGLVAVSNVDTTPNILFLQTGIVMQTNSKLGMRGNVDGSLEIWYAISESNWVKAVVIPWQSLPNPAYLYFGSVALGG